MTFHADVYERGHDVTLRMAGSLDAKADIALLAAHAEAIADDPSTLILDFHDVDYINSSGIALVVTLLIEARSTGRTVRAAGLSRHYRHIFEITRLTDYLSFDDAERDSSGHDAATTGGPSHG